jgi:hypothetical protein
MSTRSQFNWKPTQLLSLILLIAFIFPGPVAADSAATQASNAFIVQPPSYSKSLADQPPFLPLTSAFAPSRALQYGGGFNSAGGYTIPGALNEVAADQSPVSLMPEAVFEVTATNPLTNTLDVDVTSPISATFNSTLNTTTVSTSTFAVHGGFSGYLDGAFSFSDGDTQLDFDPTNDFKPGEVLQISASQAISSSGGDPLQPFVWNFTTATEESNAILSSHPVSPTFGAQTSHDIALGDLDGDSDLDVVVGKYDDLAETVWLNNGFGSFITHPISPTFGGGWTNDVALGDLDGDGDLDAVVVNHRQPATVWLNDGTGGFSAHDTTPASTRILMALVLI